MRPTVLRRPHMSFGDPIGPGAAKRSSMDFGDSTGCGDPALPPRPKISSLRDDEGRRTCSLSCSVSSSYMSQLPHVTANVLPTVAMMSAESAALVFVHESVFQGTVRQFLQRWYSSTNRCSKPLSANFEYACLHEWPSLLRARRGRAPLRSSRVLAALRFLRLRCSRAWRAITAWPGGPKTTERPDTAKHA